MQQILIVEDDASLNSGLCQALRSADRKAVSCLDLASAREQLLCGLPALVLLDVNLPDGSGLDLLGEIKSAAPAVPVILLTANDTDMDVVEGLERGADDYVTKPFSLSVLRARVNAQLRRCAGSASGGNVFCDGRFRFDFQKMLFSADGVAVELGKTDQKLLRMLVENRGNVVPRATLLERIWSDGADFVGENALSVAVKRLRDKLGAQDAIRTVYGIGYVWDGHGR